MAMVLGAGSPCEDNIEPKAANSRVEDRLTPAMHEANFSADKKDMNLRGSSMSRVSAEINGIASCPIATTLLLEQAPIAAIRGVTSTAGTSGSSTTDCHGISTS